MQFISGYAAALPSHLISLGWSGPLRQCSQTSITSVKCVSNMYTHVCTKQTHKLSLCLLSLSLHWLFMWHYTIVILGFLFMKSKQLHIKQNEIMKMLSWRCFMLRGRWRSWPCSIVNCMFLFINLAVYLEGSYLISGMICMDLEANFSALPLGLR